MAVVWDAKAGRLVRETDAEREIRESEARQARAQFEANQSQWDRMRVMSRDEQRRQQAYRQKQQDTRLARESQNTGASVNASGAGRGVSSDPYAAARAAANRALREQETSTRGASAEALAKIAGLYDPQISAAETAREDELRLLREALTGAGGQIDSATAEYLQNLAPTRAFENVPLIALEAQQNPLLDALRSQGAGTAEVEAQAGLDTALANQLRALSERASQQYGATESAYIDALRRQAEGAQLAGRQYLATRGREAEFDIGTRYADLLNELRSGRASAESDVSTQLQDALNQIIESRAEATAKYGPAPKKKKEETKVKETVVKPNAVSKPKSGGAAGSVTRR